MKKKETVSLCLIVKDEEALILSCIDSARHLVDEVVVVDTGSSDQTVRLALEAGSRAFTFTWTGNFAPARNFALEQAVSDWILVLDADEVLEPVSIEDFSRLLCAHDVEGYFLDIRNYLEASREVAWDRVVRLFRNKPAYRFAGAIHEQVAPSILGANGGKGLAVAPLVIHHFGYLKSQLLIKDKSGRNTSIIRRELEKCPDDPFLLYCLAVEYYQREDVPGGLACLKKAMTELRGTEGYYEDVVLNIAFGLLKMGRTEELVDFVGKMLEKLPAQPDLLLLRGVGYLGLGRHPEAVRDLERTLETGGCRVLPDFRLLSYLGDAYNLAGDYPKAEKFYLSALARSSKFLYPLTQVLGLLQRSKGTCRFVEICRFTSFREKRVAWKELTVAGEVSLAAVVLLLSIYEVSFEDVMEDESLIQLSQNFSLMLSRLKSLSGEEASLQYLPIAAREMTTYAGAVERGFDCHHFLARRRLRLLVENLLQLLITQFCPRWAPGPITLTAFDNT